MYVWERRRHASLGFRGRGDGRFGRTSSPLPGGHLGRTDAACLLGAGGVEYDAMVHLSSPLRHFLLSILLFSAFPSSAGISWEEGWGPCFTSLRRGSYADS